MRILLRNSVLFRQLYEQQEFKHAAHRERQEGPQESLREGRASEEEEGRVEAEREGCVRPQVRGE